ncbi:MAG: hypothetical protein KAI70_00795, partial [Candidatus Omnitrophica bacterium]|nr:hypothetical protein [Candidatus Omnitrophota bacterium]
MPYLTSICQHGQRGIIRERTIQMESNDTISIRALNAEIGVLVQENEKLQYKISEFKAHSTKMSEAIETQGDEASIKMWQEVNVKLKKELDNTNKRLRAMISALETANRAYYQEVKELKTALYRKKTAADIKELNKGMSASHNTAKDKIKSQAIEINALKDVVQILEEENKDFKNLTEGRSAKLLHMSRAEINTHNTAKA